MADSDRLHTLIDAYLDERITPDDMAELDALLQAAPEARTAFRASLRDHHALIESLVPRALPAAPTNSASPKSAIGNRQSAIRPRPTPFIVYPIAIAAALLFTAAIAVVYLIAFNTDPQPDPIQPNQPGPAVATLIENTGDLRTPHGFTAEGDSYGRGEYTLSGGGSAEFMLTNAVNVKLRGETRLYMHNDMHVSLTRGSAEFVCPSGASGFTVQLHGGVRVVDLGTRFRVQADEDGEAEIVVVSGRVRVNGPHDEPIELFAGQVARAVGDDRGTRIVRADHPEARLTAYYDFEGDDDDALDDPAGDHRDNLVSRGVVFNGDSPLGIRGTHSATFNGDATLSTRAFTGDLGPDPDAYTIMFWIKARDIDQENNNIRVLSTRRKPDGSKATARWQVEGIGNDGSSGDKMNVRMLGENRAWFSPMAIDAIARQDQNEFAAEWHHVAYVLSNTGHPDDGGAYAVTYVDGVPVGGVYNPDPSWDGYTLGNVDGQLILGSDKTEGGSRDFVGQLDDVALFAGVVSPEQIAEIASGQLSPAEFLSNPIHPPHAERQP